MYEDTKQVAKVAMVYTLYDVPRIFVKIAVDQSVNL